MGHAQRTGLNSRGHRDPLICARKKKQTLIHSKSFRHKTDNSESARMLTNAAKNSRDKGKLPDVVQYRTDRLTTERTFFSFIITFLYAFPELA